MRKLATRGPVSAWVDDDFDPETGDVELRVPGLPPEKFRWQTALKWGYWESAD